MRIWPDAKIMALVGEATGSINANFFKFHVKNC